MLLGWVLAESTEVNCGIPNVIASYLYPHPSLELFQLKLICATQVPNACCEALHKKLQKCMENLFGR